MNEEVQFIIDSTKEQMESAIHHLELEFVNIRAGKATPSMLNSVKVEYYGSLNAFKSGSKCQYHGCAYHYGSTLGKTIDS